MTAENELYRFPKGYIKFRCNEKDQPILDLFGIIGFDQIKNVVQEVRLGDQFIKKVLTVLEEGISSIENLFERGGTIDTEGKIENIHSQQTDLLQRVDKDGPNTTAYFVLAKNFGQYLSYVLTTGGTPSIYRVETKAGGLKDLPISFIPSLGRVFVNLYEREMIHAFIPGVSLAKQVLADHASRKK